MEPPTPSFLQSFTTATTTSTNATCAACKHQRRKCKPGCPMAPYFPASLPRRFAAVHRLFGVSNVSKVQDGVAPDLRDRAMGAIIYEAETRQRDPVHGAYGEIARLTEQVEAAARELWRVRAQLWRCRRLAEAQEGWSAPQQQWASSVPSLLAPLPPGMMTAVVGGVDGADGVYGYVRGPKEEEEEKREV